jgi:hypothetical protein
MSAIDDITKLAQSIYLAGNNRYKDVTGTELTNWLAQIIDWVNQFTPELELEADWNYLRENSSLIATISDPDTQSYAIPPTVRKVVISPYRDATISFDGAVVSTFSMVAPDQITNPADPSTVDRATVINGKLVLSRPLKDTEVGGDLCADVIKKMPVLTTSDVTLLTTVKPYQLLVLGVAKNITLPDIIQGGISPSLTQKYADLLQKAVAENNATAEAYDTPGEDFSFIRGVY